MFKTYLSISRYRHQILLNQHTTNPQLQNHEISHQKNPNV